MHSLTILFFYWCFIAPRAGQGLLGSQLSDITHPLTPGLLPEKDLKTRLVNLNLPVVTAVSISKPSLTILKIGPLEVSNINISTHNILELLKCTLPDICCIFVPLGKNTLDI